MNQPPAFSWIEKPHLAAMGLPSSVEELRWLRKHGIELLISLTEDPPNTRDVSDAGLLLYHVPVTDMTAPTPEDLQRCISAIVKAQERGMGVGIHCAAGAGRTGTVLACYFVERGADPEQAIQKTRRLRPTSIETQEQEDAVKAFARGRKRKADKR